MRSVAHIALTLVAVTLVGCLQTTRTPVQVSGVNYDSGDIEKTSLNDARIEKYLRLHADFPDEPKYAERLARLYLTQGDYKEALHFLAEAREIDPGNPKYDFIEGRVYLSIGNFVGAEKAYLQMVSHTPDEYVGPQFELGWLYYNMNQNEAASARFVRCLEIDETLPDPHYYLGEIALRKGDKAKAIDHFEWYLRLEGTLYERNVLRHLKRLQPELSSYRPRLDG